MDEIVKRNRRELKKALHILNRYECQLQEVEENWQETKETIGYLRTFLEVMRKYADRRKQ